MNNEKLLKRAENDIRIGVKSIRDGKKTPKEARLGKKLNIMKVFDEVLHIELMNLYKNALRSPFCKK